MSGTIYKRLARALIVVFAAAAVFLAGPLLFSGDAHAADGRTEVHKVVATSWNIDRIPVNLTSLTTQPYFDVTEGKPALFTNEHVSSGWWEIKQTDGTWQAVKSGTFYPGTWRYRCQLRIDCDHGTNDGEKYKLALPLRVLVNGEDWYNADDLMGLQTYPTYTYMWVASPEYTVYEASYYDMKNASIDPIPDHMYTGSAIKPKPVVRFGRSVLTEGKHYTLSYANNVNEGKASVTITGAGGIFKGSKTVYFNITPACSKIFTLGGNTMIFKNNTYISKRLPTIARPYQLSLTARTDKQMLIQWTDCKKLGANIDGYLVMRRVGSEKAYTEYASTPATQNYFYDNKITAANQNYYYIVLAYKKGSNGVYTVSSDSMSVVGLRWDSVKINPHECPVKNPTAAIKAKYGLPTLNKTSATIKAGEKLQLSISYPKGSFSTWTRWRPDKSAVASVDSTGLVTGKSKGTTLISARTPNGRDIRCTVTVK